MPFYMPQPGEYVKDIDLKGDLGYGSHRFRRIRKRNDFMDYIPFMQSALIEARQALDRGEFPVGCVISNAGEILVSGCRANSRPETRNELDHAEMVALRRLVDLGPEIDPNNLCVFTTLEPCLMCYSALILNGIKTIIYAYEDTFGGGTTIDLKPLRPFYRHLNVKVVSGVLREKSRTLFRDFFSSPDNSYLRQSPLARQVLREP
jgi:tRNA(adenine34) deaminase